MSQLVLLIESEPWLGDQFQSSLEQQDITVSRATNAYAAIDMIDDRSPDVIVMSLLLSGAGGLGLLHELQSYIDTAGIPVIVCSSLASLDIRDLAPYGVRRLIDTTTMQPEDLNTAVWSVIAEGKVK